MKTKTLLLSLALLTIFASACNKNKDNDIQKLDPEGDCFTAKVDGVLFESDNVTGTNTSLVLVIGATSGSTTLQVFGINLINTNVGTYAISVQSGAEATATYAPSSLSLPVLYVGTSGTLTISEHDTIEKRIKGTFSFEGDDGAGGTISVTEGLFDLRYN
jgi:Family of unknown function (DUF6252)